MGATSTKVLLVEKGQLKKVRSIRMNSFLNGSSARLIPPAEADGGPGQGGSGPAHPLASYSIEARFQEIENALRRLDPVTGGETGTALAMDEPIAILTDEEFDMVRRGGTMASSVPLVEPLADLPVEMTSPEASPRPPLPGANPGVPVAPKNGGANGATGAPSGEIDYGQYLRRLGLEIQRTFATVSAGSAVELICLTGGMSHREEARRFFTEEFDVETIALDFGDSFPSELAPDAQAELSRVGAVAVGLAMKELGGDRVGFDFRKKEFRFERKFERLKYPILCVAALTFLVFLQTTLSLYYKHRRLSEVLRYVQTREQEMYREFFGKENSSRLLLNQAEAEKKKWESLLGVGGINIPAFVPVIDALDEITRGIRETGAQPRVETIDLKLRTRSLKQGKLSAESPSSVDLTTSQQGLGTQLEKAFSRPNGIFSANASETKRPQTGTVQINLKLNPQEKYLNDLRK
jgi:hypothetical protein